MKSKINRYYCGNGEGMFEDKKGDWVEYSEYEKLKENNALLLDALKDAVDDVKMYARNDAYDWGADTNRAVEFSDTRPSVKKANEAILKVESK